MADFTPTSEQQVALDLFATGDNLAISAGAGTGKTATLRMLAEAAPKLRGQYVAFNKAIVEDGKTSFPSSVRCNTAHSLAWASTGQPFASRLRNGARMKSLDVANMLRLDGIAVNAPMGRKLLGRPYLGSLVMQATKRFCSSADLEPSYKHVPYIEGIDGMEAEGRRGYANNREVAKAIEPAIKRAWEDLRTPNGQLPFNGRHDVYLKLAHLGGMTIGADYILFDECQDANPVLVAIVEAQEHAQLVWVGDEQQAIYGFTGAINALANIAAESRATLTQSFRFGEAVAEEANTILSWIASADLRLTGLDSIPSVVLKGDDETEAPATDAILTRTNATAVREVLQAQRAGKRAFLVGGGREIVAFADAAEKLMRNEKTYHPELACFDNWGEVQDYVNQDEQGDDLRLLVSLVDEFGVDTIREALGGLGREDDCDVIVSTAHKSKGREWNHVRIAGDFPEDRGNLGDDEKRLLYVAVTRAKLSLDISAVSVLDPAYDSPDQAAARETAAEARRARAEAAAARLAARADQAPEVVEDVALAEGRYEIAGEVVSVKESYGRRNLLVRINGDCRVYGTCPADLNGVKRGDKVRFTATVERSKDDDTFGFFSRPR